jgi:Lon protease-like protein
MVTELPLFPLNLVLFPGMPLNLHIFEERYKLMINECIEKRQPFGIVLISNNETDTSQNAEPHLIGCTAQITQVQPLSQGRMNITVIGRERFHVLSLNHDKPYLSGTTETYPMIVDDTPQIPLLKHCIQRYLRVLQETGQIQTTQSTLPNDSKVLVYLAAVLLQVEPIKKQELLLMESVSAMTDTLIKLYQYETLLLNTLLSPPDEIDVDGIFSLN